MCVDCHGKEAECLDGAIAHLIKEKLDVLIAKLDAMNTRMEKDLAKTKRLYEINERRINREPHLPLVSGI
jgi:hypothetical protein